MEKSQAVNQMQFRTDDRTSYVWVAVAMSILLISPPVFLFFSGRSLYALYTFGVALLLVIPLSLATHYTFTKKVTVTNYDMTFESAYGKRSMIFSAVNMIVLKSVWTKAGYVDLITLTGNREKLTLNGYLEEFSLLKATSSNVALMLS